MCFQGFLEPGSHYQMKINLESKLQVVLQKIASSGIYYLILVWLIKIVIFVLWIGKCILIWLLRLSFWLIRECIRRYVSVALVGLTLAPQSRDQDTKQIFRRKESFTRSLDLVEEEEVVEAEVHEKETTSPLFPIVLRDRVQICEEVFAIKDRERLLYEFDQIVAPQVSAFQLGEIVVPINDTRQLATFLKLKLSQTCKEQSVEAINAAICGAILNIRSKGAISNCVESCSQNHGNIMYVVVYIAARLRGDDKIHLVLVGRKVEDFLGSSEFRNRFNPPRTQGDKEEWYTWTFAHLQSLKESAVQTAEELLSLDPVDAQVCVNMGAQLLAIQSESQNH
ncbi:uncharacterized protein [Physcomitrium patens]|uniref:Uncharacterized protein n=1 Tax=Physcomitrium patens TaxID=3218 RepID=A0A7I3ZYM6_PHYPA|nr:uncharacterized protein LOC112287293 isoform X2 [Physcomitrium patens]|eukprot:XP_024385949.1 uncharacterized protein LOC112287293 isoform X2 [Physcomitrella patens]